MVAKHPNNIFSPTISTRLIFGFVCHRIYSVLLFIGKVQAARKSITLDRTRTKFVAVAFALIAVSVTISLFV